MSKLSDLTNGLTPLSPTAYEFNNWPSFVSYEKEAGYPKRSRALRIIDGSYRAGIWANSSNIVFTYTSFPTEDAANAEAERKISELLCKK